ncbi:MAG: DUF4974 domain-containing protein [Candidatus Pseudobacter hemicellulosilyticus]|uniref:DUF4974 domain-containing protein n=1 Tax=Candidatus Pseudobacter hemicellulosilyticus TaxID=3121375 RepID=A0AAJ5WXH1_9BACT|nr:MAG: DUF4974 domain-containing protein [Pseudobacter sp.]
MTAGLIGLFSVIGVTIYLTQRSIAKQQKISPGLAEKKTQSFIPLQRAVKYSDTSTTAYHLTAQYEFKPGERLVTDSAEFFKASLPGGGMLYMDPLTVIRFTQQHHLELLSGEIYLFLPKGSRYELSTPKLRLFNAAGQFQLTAYPAQHAAAAIGGLAYYTDRKATPLKLPAGKKLVESNGVMAITALTKADYAVKDNKFNFEEFSFTTNMDRVARWYNVRLRYQGDTVGINRKYVFEGSMSRETTLKTIIKILTDCGVPLSLDSSNRQVIIYPDSTRN